FRLLGLKRNLPGRQAGIEIFVPDEAFFALHSLSYGVRKRQNLPAVRQVWDKKIILQPIIISLNDLIIKVIRFSVRNPLNLRSQRIDLKCKQYYRTILQFFLIAPAGNRFLKLI